MPIDTLRQRAATPSSGQFLPGVVIGGRYRMVGLIGRGGMGEVYRADDLKVGQSVALKFLPAEVERDAGRLDRFLSEVRMSLRVTHPNVCRVLAASLAGITVVAMLAGMLAFHTVGAPSKPPASWRRWRSRPSGTRRGAVGPKRNAARTDQSYRTSASTAFQSSCRMMLSIAGRLVQPSRMQSTNSVRS
ncbi:MAG TPA: hypothetical protein VN700_19755 [Vicinamibacterales bacterium]|nr:hypothetical protein [Vicinamibacterales bacterium]